MPKALAEGDIIQYPYRWAGDAAEGRAPEGGKDRPSCLVLLIKDAAGRSVIFLAPISSKPPRGDQIALSIPETERRRAGLEKYPEAWVFVDEVNTDMLGESWYMKPQNPMGTFGRAFLAKVAAAIRTNLRARRAVNRR